MSNSITHTLPIPGTPATAPRPAPVKDRLAYLVSEYPALSHTFILREIDALEEAGYAVHPFSIRRPGNTARLGQREREAMAKTIYLLDGKFLSLIAALCWILADSPRGCFRMLRRTATALCKNPARPLHAMAYFLEACLLVRHMKNKGIAHVHNHFGNAAGTTAWIAAAFPRQSFSISVHGPDIFYDAERECLPEKIRDAAFVRAIGDYCRSQLYLLSESRHWPKIKVARCGIEPTQFPPRPTTGNTIPRVLCVGRLVPAKGQALLVEASIRLNRRGVRHQLVLVGDGPDRPALQQRVSDALAERWISFTGGLSQEDVREQYRRADLFVLPSFAEGIPVVLMEAMAREIPVISTTITGIPELIENRRNGFLVAPGSTESLAATIGDALSRLHELAPLARAGRQTVLRHYNLSHNGPAITRLFESLSTNNEI